MNRAVAKIVLLFVVFGCGCFAAARTGQPPQAQTAKKGQAKAGNASQGEQRFRANCGRCHNPPEDISPREARAVIRQMRVRAMLSAEDEKLILEYIAP